MGAYIERDKYQNLQPLNRPDPRLVEVRELQRRVFEAKIEEGLWQLARALRIPPPNLARRSD